MNYIDKKYLNLLSSRLENFSWTSATKARCRCPMCGDSKVSKKKTRGSFYPHKTSQEFMYNCYNCGEDMSFASFLYKIDPILWKEYKFELFKDSNPSPIKKEDIEVDLSKLKSSYVIERIFPEDLKNIAQLSDSHPAKEYCLKRKLDKFLDTLYYCPNFPKWASENFEELNTWKGITKHPRLIIPCYDANKKFIGLQGRCFGKEIPKYATLRLYSDRDFLFGLDRVDLNQRVYILEGPIDSLFVDNSVAVMSSNLNSVNIFNDSVLVFDNQPRNREIVKMMDEAINLGKTIVIWPKNYIYKDINDGIKGGIKQEEIMNIINENTFSGMAANINLNNWRLI